MPPLAIRRTKYYYTLLDDRPGLGVDVLSTLRASGISLLAFTTFPLGDGRRRPLNARDRLAQASRRRVDPPPPSLVHHGALSWSAGFGVGLVEGSIARSEAAPAGDARAFRTCASSSASWPPPSRTA